MNRQGPSFSGKNLIIILLVAVVAVQGYFLLRRNGASPRDEASTAVQDAVPMVAATGADKGEASPAPAQPSEATTQTAPSAPAAPALRAASPMS